MAEEKLETKLDKLNEILREMDGVVIAFSGGTDSTFLLKIANVILGKRVLAVTGISPTYTQEEYERACEFARYLGVRHMVIETNELDNPEFSANPYNRCYYCKKELFQKLWSVAKCEGLSVVVDATNLDDCSDYRPGRIAAKEAGVRSPLVEAGLKKQEIRTLSKTMDLPTWDMPSMACLASRFPYNETITSAKLDRVSRSEVFLRDFGFRQVRVRSHGEIARIELDLEKLQKILDPGLQQKVVSELKSLGFVYITVDLEGYRTGSMNEILSGGSVEEPE